MQLKEMHKEGKTNHIREKQWMQHISKLENAHIHNWLHNLGYNWLHNLGYNWLHNLDYKIHPSYSINSLRLKIHQ